MPCHLLWQIDLLIPKILGSSWLATRRTHSSFYTRWRVWGYWKRCRRNNEPIRKHLQSPRQLMSIHRNTPHWPRIQDHRGVHMHHHLQTALRSMFMVLAPADIFQYISVIRWMHWLEVIKLHTDNGISWIPTSVESICGSENTWRILQLVSARIFLMFQSIIFYKKQWMIGLRTTYSCLNPHSIRWLT